MWQANMRGRSGLGGTTGRTASCTTFVLDLRSAVCYYRVIGTEERAKMQQMIVTYVVIPGNVDSGCTVCWNDRQNEDDAIELIQTKWCTRLTDCVWFVPGTIEE